MNRRLPIAKKLLVMVLTTSAILSTLMTVAQIIFEYKEKQSQQADVIAGLETGLLPSVGQRVWDYDFSSIPDQFRGLMKNLDIARIKLETSTGKIVFDESRPDFKPQFPINIEMPVVFDDQGNKVKVATLSVQFFSDRIIAEIRFHFLTLFVFNLIKTAIVSLVLITIFRRTVTNPILEIVDYFEKADVNKTKSDHQLTIHRKGPEDEITDLVGYIVAHERQLKELQSAQQNKIQSQERALEESDEKLKEEKARSEMSARLAHMAEMASGIAHEINNPLAIIQGYFGVAKMECKKPAPDLTAVQGYLVKGEQSVTRAAKIVSSLRDFARDPANDPISRVTIRQILDDLPALIGMKIKTTGVDFTINNLCPDDVEVDCRKVAVDQALYALINNSLEAVKSQHSGWIRVESAIKGSRVEISIVDSGKGIAPDVAAKMFQPFFTTKDVGQGAGLGLAMAQGVFTHHGGELYYDKLSPNTCFKIVMPVAAATMKSA